MSEGFDVHALLTIDVGSEIRKLGRVDALTLEQVPAEVVRRALRAGARHIDVEVSARGIEILDDSMPPVESSLVALSELLNDALAAARRHRALLQLEHSSERGWLALAGTGAAILIETAPTTKPASTPARGFRLEVRPGYRPSLVALSTPVPRNRLVISGLRLRLAAVRSAVENVCRFATARVRVDASPLRAGFDSAVAEAALKPPLQGRIALSGSADDARVWLLMHGSVAAHVSLPHEPGYEAVVEMSGRVPDASPAAALREAALSLAPALLRQFAGLLEREAARYDSWAAEEQPRLRRGVLRACSAGIDTLAELRVLPVVGRSASFLSLEDLRRVASQTRAITTLFPDQVADRFRLPAEPTFVLDAYERDLVAKLADVRFVAPQRRSPPSWRRRVADLRAGGRAALTRASAYWPSWHQALPAHVLSDAERALLAALSAPPEAAPFQRVALHAGHGRVRLRGRCLWLPREDELVLAAVRALSEDGVAWRRTVVLALLGTRGGLGVGSMIGQEDEDRRIEQLRLPQPIGPLQGAQGADPYSIGPDVASGSKDDP
jgi:hypothetical protein